jgi:hypothetical protein
MIIHNLNKFPDFRSYERYDLYEFTEFDLDNLIGKGIDEIWYWYGCGGYEGIGWVLLRQGDTYDLHDLGHCSCFGPLDYCDPMWQSPETIRERYSSEVMSEVADLLKAAKL